MAGPPTLSAWLGDVLVASVREARTGKLALQYSGEALEQWRLNTPVLSVSLPLRMNRYPPGVATPYLEGLLPEGEARTTLEQHFTVRRGDTYGLLAAIGRDCAGAVVLQPQDEPPPGAPAGLVDWIDDEALVAAVADLPARPLGAGEDVRVSLAGQQAKLLLARRADGRWGIPRGGHPSTHILKPEDARYPGMAANEAFCLRAASALGLTTVEVETLLVDNRPVLAVTRYDRATGADGTVRRLHQEDTCQALAIDTSRSDSKYEVHGGPRLAQVADILDRLNGKIEQLDLLLQVATFTVAVGNADAHGKNLSLLNDPVGTIRLAPLYDVMSTIHYPHVSTPDGRRPVSTDLAMRVNGRGSVHEVTVDDLVAEAVTWSYPRNRAADLVAATLEALPDAVTAAAAATHDLPAEIPERIILRVRALARGAAAAEP